MIKPPGFLEEDSLITTYKDYYYSFGDYTQGEARGMQRESTVQSGGKWVRLEFFQQKY